MCNIIVRMLEVIGGTKHFESKFILTIILLVHSNNNIAHTNFLLYNFYTTFFYLLTIHLFIFNAGPILIAVFITEMVILHKYVYLLLLLLLSLSTIKVKGKANFSSKREERVALPISK